MTTFVFVHGAFGDGSGWQQVARGVEGAGHRAVVIDRLPSTGTNPATLGDLAADAACVRRVLDDVDAPVALVGHSYGGMVITEVADHPVIGGAPTSPRTGPSPDSR